MEHVTASVMGTTATADDTAGPRSAAIPVTPSVAAFASGVAAELAPITRDLLAIETTGELPAAAPSAVETEDDRRLWWQPQAPVRGGELTLLGVLAASQPAMRRLAFLAEVRPARWWRRPHVDLQRCAALWLPRCDQRPDVGYQGSLMLNMTRKSR